MQVDWVEDLMDSAADASKEGRYDRFLSEGTMFFVVVVCGVLEVGVESGKAEREEEVEYTAAAHAGFFWWELKGFFQSQSLRPGLSRLLASNMVKYEKSTRACQRSSVHIDNQVYRFVSYRHDGNKESHTREVSTIRCQPMNQKPSDLTLISFEDHDPPFAYCVVKDSSEVGHD
ncbi:uncharacterized protein LACBIDRAFT_336234 [Laccaria bicolor S238N-H82]|uniref:Predicted protein n=1 Tax=Laccaria bicolor (strain S238N-H82 / ATCC MYA-4686) TaxID=486041 RepID=B0E4T6_LACBS|nr:uncharacterized protein LACBIDRAFT_336234 [Laccaria bicolor S238N-H82]EDQ98145.1 predicted protein [Laccaria bicolor S238N-H82]|eukprot:XP_001891204.1 predicted protein [Laccaria bicolor S238N-H82]